MNNIPITSIKPFEIGDKVIIIDEEGCSIGGLGDECIIKVIRSCEIGKIIDAEIITGGDTGRLSTRYSYRYALSCNEWDS